MFSALDNIIFPDSCEVIEIVPSQHYVYPIFKNGSSSLHQTQLVKNWQSIYNQDIEKITTPITVYLRDPRERFISGVNTFVQLCKKENPDLDVKTILHFVKQYPFLNRHYAPQFYWLINLSRYSKNKLIFQDLDSINNIVDIDDPAGIDPPSKEFLCELETFPWSQLELYFFLDQILIDHIGKPTSFTEVTDYVQQQHKELFELLFTKPKSICNVLSKT